MDLNVTAFRIVQELTTEESKEDKRSEAASAAGKIGGVARARKLTPTERKSIARKANMARWGGRAKG